jgi:hypothetical protein
MTVIVLPIHANSNEPDAGTSAKKCKPTTSAMIRQNVSMLSPSLQNKNRQRYGDCLKGNGEPVSVGMKHPGSRRGRGASQLAYACYDQRQRQQRGRQCQADG